MNLQAGGYSLFTLQCQRMHENEMHAVDYYLDYIRTSMRCVS